METNYWSQAEYEWNRKTNDEKKEYFKRQVDIALTCYFNYCSNEEILNFSECLYNKSLNIKKCKHVPNEETIKAMEESKNGNLKKYSSLDELWKDLMSDD